MLAAGAELKFKIEKRNISIEQMPREMEEGARCNTSSPSLQILLIYIWNFPHPDIRAIAIINTHI